MQEIFAYGELFMLVMIGYIFMFKMVKKKMQNSGLEIVTGLTCPLMWLMSFISFHFILFRKTSKDKKHRKEYIKVHLFPLWSLR